ncbi:MAG: SAM-dependent methyltransferase, partial [bacterium]
IQEVLGHDPLIGRRLASILQETGFQKIASSPRVLYADASQEQLLDDMVNKIILPMMKGAGEMIMKHQIIDQHTWEKGIQDIRLSGVPPEGSFFYSWFKATGIK